MKRALSASATEHFHITKKKSVCAGDPVVKGTRVSVASIAGYYLMGLSPEEIQREIPHLTLAQVFDALAYNLDHREEMDSKIERDAEERVSRDFPSGKY